MTTNGSAGGTTPRLRVLLWAAAMRGAASGAVHAGLTWLLGRLTDAG